MLTDFVSNLLQFHFFLSLCTGLRRFSGVPVAFKAPLGAISRQNGPIRATAEDQKNWDTISTDELADWKQEGPPTPLLDTVNFPVHIKNFNQKQLQQLCRELRAGKPYSHFDFWCRHCLNYFAYFHVFFLLQISSTPLQKLEVILAQVLEL
jgi:hypothetical protein